jgi:hypothetical protein
MYVRLPSDTKFAVKEMWAAGFILWACSLVGMSCDASTPNVALIQSACEREASNGGKLHDRGLRLLEATCDSSAAGGFLCQVTFMSNDDPNQRLYFDVVAVTRTAKGWELRSGLCKR